MAEDISQLLSPGVITRVTRDLPAREQPQPRHRRKPARPSPSRGSEPESDGPPDDAPTVGSRLNVRA